MEAKKRRHQFEHVKHRCVRNQLSKSSLKARSSPSASTFKTRLEQDGFAGVSACLDEASVELLLRHHPSCLLILANRLAVNTSQFADRLDAHRLPLQFFQHLHVSPP